ncbi:hypothetical protein [uncultured Anaerofustis sp.]|uniref:hypothetical protein n=1 Tax=uncultured Anaerofustis sp. TaxID=904996 RepID=UPI0025D9901B|nr:hypothetical protein [uncultured Anaerofustis sp.]
MEEIKQKGFLYLIGSLLLMILSVILFRYLWVPLLLVLFIYNKKIDSDKNEKKKVLIIGFIIFFISFLSFIFVPSNPVRPEKINISCKSYNMDINSIQAIDIEVFPDDANINNLEYISADKSVIKINKEDGKIIVKSFKEGKSDLYITDSESGVKSNVITVRVIDKRAQALKKKKQKLKKNSNKITYVYISRTGSKYHSNKYCSHMRKPNKVTIKKAKSTGYTPCKKCY